MSKKCETNVKCHFQRKEHTLGGTAFSEENAPGQ